MKYDDILDEMERKNPGISRAMADSLSDQEEKDSLLSFVTPKGVPEGVIQATRQNYSRPLSPAEMNPEQESSAVQEFISRSGRYPGSSEREVLDSMPAPRGEDSGITYSNYRTGPGIKLPEGMPMMGEEPRQETEQEFLVKNGALDIVGHDPYRAAWDRTVKKWDGWFDIMGGDPTPENPNFRATYGKKFDEDLQTNQSEELSKRNQGMEKITRLINQYRGSMDQEGNPIPDATEADVLKAMGIKGLPGIKDPRDYRGGVGDADMASFKAKKREEIRLQGEADNKAKEVQTKKEKELANVINKMNGAYTGIESQAKGVLSIWKNRLSDVEAYYKEGKGDSKELIDKIRKYQKSITNLETFVSNFDSYVSADKTAIMNGVEPVNWKKVQQYWEEEQRKWKAILEQ